MYCNFGRVPRSRTAPRPQVVPVFGSQPGCANAARTHNRPGVEESFLRHPTPHLDKARLFGKHGLSSTGLS
jgi:hypothetical protein